MGRRTKRDMSLEEFDAWEAAHWRVGELNETANEVGGPQLSLFPSHFNKLTGKLQSIAIQRDTINFINFAAPAGPAFSPN